MIAGMSHHAQYATAASIQAFLWTVVTAKHNGGHTGSKPIPFKVANSWAGCGLPESAPSRCSSIC